MNLKYYNPQDIEKKSFEIISELLGDRRFYSDNESIIKRVIHTTADFDYADNLCFSDNVVKKAINAIKNGANIVTDTKMAMAGINKTVLEKFNGKVHCFISDDNVINESKERNMTRSAISMEYASKLNKPLIFAIGNAPTALIRLYELINDKKLKPEIVIGVPVGFVNVIEAKELIMSTNVPFIISKGRKGGSNVAAAICNAIIYSIK